MKNETQLQSIVNLISEFDIKSVETQDKPEFVNLTLSVEKTVKEKFDRLQSASKKKFGKVCVFAVSKSILAVKE